MALEELLLRIYIFILALVLPLNNIYYPVWTNYVNGYADKFHIAQENLEKNYIFNVRVIDGVDDCQKNEVALSTVIKEGGKEYSLDVIFVSQSLSNQTLIKLCQEIHYEMSFDQIIKNKQHSNILDDQVCRYNGLTFKPRGKSNKCPISDLIFSNQEEEEEERDGYEKIANKKENGINIFIKRIDEHLTPLTQISIIRNKTKATYLQKSMNITFSMADICEEQYGFYEAICSSDSKPNEIEYTLYKENQIALDSECNNQLLTFDQNKFKPNSLTDLFSIPLYLIEFAISYLCYSHFLTEPFKKIVFVALRKVCTVIILVRLVMQIFLYFSIEEGYNSNAQNCYRNGNPLESLLGDLTLFFTLIQISIGISLVCVLINFILFVVSKLKCAQKKNYQTFNNQEMEQV